MTQNAKVIVFDLDGTLVDSADDIMDALNFGMRLAGRPPVSGDAGRRIISLGMEKMVELALQDSGGLPAAQVLAQIQHASMRRYDERLLHSTQPYPGTTGVLDGLRSRQVRLGVCTNKRLEPANRVLAGLGLDGYFDVVIGRDSGEFRKPHPAPLLAALRGLAAAPAHAVMVGDSEIDVECAKAAGVRVILMRHGYSGGPVEALGADCVVDDFPGLSTALDVLYGDAA